MDRGLPRRVAVLGWGNLVIGVLFPAGALFNLLGAARVFSVASAEESIVVTTIVGMVLGYLHWTSGKAILKRRAEGFDRTCLAGCLTLGYTALGILLMAISGRDGLLVVLIRHGSTQWWDWSLSHFQHSALREIPMLVWWVYGLGTLVRFRFPGASESVWDRLWVVLARSLPFCFVGMVVRQFQILTDSSLYSQR